MPPAPPPDFPPLHAAAVLQVPLHIGNAFKTAAQHGWMLDGTDAALVALSGLLGAALSTGIIKEGVGASSIAISMRRQLQQAGVLQQLAAGMAATAADLRSEAAALPGMSQEELCSDVKCFSALNGRTSLLGFKLTVILAQCTLFRELWGSQDRTVEANNGAWLSDPSGYAAAAMQLCSAALQHASSVLQHVLLAIRQRLPQQEAELLQGQRVTVTAVLKLGNDLVIALSRIQLQLPLPACLALSRQMGQSSTVSLSTADDMQAQQLLMSSQTLPFIASLMVLQASCVVKACSRNSKGPGGRSSSSSSCGGAAAAGSSGKGSGSASSRVGNISTASSTSASAAGSSSVSSSVSSSRGDVTPTPCQLELYELLGLSPQLTALVEQLPQPEEV
jgi:hypothetical protein